MMAVIALAPSDDPRAAASFQDGEHPEIAKGMPASVDSCQNWLAYHPNLVTLPSRTPDPKAGSVRQTGGVASPCPGHFCSGCPAPDTHGKNTRGWKRHVTRPSSCQWLRGKREGGTEFPAPPCLGEDGREFPYHPRALITVLLSSGVRIGPAKNVGQICKRGLGAS